MRIFISYAREDRAAVAQLVEDLEQAQHTVWMDRSLRGGQVWWDAILDEIASADAYVFVLSPASSQSRACDAEARWAGATCRPALVAQIADADFDSEAGGLPGRPRIDLRERTVESVIELVTMLAELPIPPPLPDPEPERPAVPITYLHTLDTRISVPALTAEEQIQVLAEIAGLIVTDDERSAGRELLQRFARRSDLSSTARREIDRLFNVHRRAGIIPQGRRHPSTAPLIMLTVLAPLMLGITGVVAIMLSTRALKDFETRPGHYRNRRTVVTLRILAVIGTALAIPYLWWVISTG